MPTIDQTVQRIVEAASWDQRVAQIRLISQNHGTGRRARYGEHTIDAWLRDAE